MTDGSSLLQLSVFLLTSVSLSWIHQVPPNSEKYHVGKALHDFSSFFFFTVAMQLLYWKMKFESHCSFAQCLIFLNLSPKKSAMLFILSGRCRSTPFYWQRGGGKQRAKEASAVIFWSCGFYCVARCVQLISVGLQGITEFNACKFV